MSICFTTAASEQRGETCARRTPGCVSTHDDDLRALLVECVKAMDKLLEASEERPRLWADVQEVVDRARRYTVA